MQRLSLTGIMFSAAGPVRVTHGPADASTPLQAVSHICVLGAELGGGGDPRP